MSHDLKILNPIEVADWDEQILAFPDYSFFHSSAWARVLSESYGYRPYYLTRWEGEKLKAVVPMMEVSSILTGRRGVSLPFTDFCEPLGAEDKDFEELFPIIRDLGHKRDWKTIGFRGKNFSFPDGSPSAAYYVHTLSLEKEPGIIFSQLKNSHQRNIRKARKIGVKVELHRDQEALKEFCRLNSLTRRDHGLPPQPFHFFKKLGKDILDRNQGFVAMADYQGEKVAGAVFFHFGGKAVYKYGASNKKFQQVRANNLIMWEAIQWLAEHDFRELHFGRTDLYHEGLRRFKIGWGTEERRIHYRQYDMRKQAFTIPRESSPGFSEKIFRRMPPFLLDRIGALLYRHVG
jgi:hypothetical protein